MFWHQPDVKVKSGNFEINHNIVNKILEPVNNPALTSGKEILSGLTFFCVSHTDSLNERVLWSIQTDSGTDVIMTNRRMANIEQTKYINFNTPKKGVPQIITFSRKIAVNDSVAGTIQIYIGTNGGKAIPASNFQGLLPEIIVYDRVLPFSERLRVESYLALKYGISLGQAFPTSYQNSRGEIIWNASKYQAYSSAIAGVGRDDTSGLLQLKSGSMETPGLLEIECRGLTDRDFLIWGNNKGSLTFSAKRGEGKKLQRRWLVSATGNFTEKPASLYFAASQIQEIQPLDSDEIYWLAVDYSGTGNFPSTQTGYFPNKANNQHLQFDGINWDTDKSGHDLFTIIAAPEMFAAFTIEQPSCKDNQKGSITTRIVGGTPPFQVHVWRDGEEVSKQMVADRLNTYNHLLQGTYRFNIIDAYNKTYSEEFLLANTDMEQLPYFEPQILLSGQSLRFDAKEKLWPADKFSYQWDLPTGEKIYSSELMADRSGIYLLSVTNSEGCTTKRELDIRSKTAGYFNRVELFPNPTNTGKVYIKVQLRQIGPILVRITNASGHILSSELLTGDNFYSFNCQLPHAGIWFITLDGNGERNSFKVISK